MVTYTMDAAAMAAPRSRSRGAFSRFLDDIVEARMRRGRSIAKPYLLALSDEDLTRLGHSRAEVERWQSRPEWVAGL